MAQFAHEIFKNQSYFPDPVLSIVAFLLIGSGLGGGAGGSFSVLPSGFSVRLDRLLWVSSGPAQSPGIPAQSWYPGSSDQQGML